MKIEGQGARMGALELLEAVLRRKHPLEDMLESVEALPGLIRAIVPLPEI